MTIQIKDGKISGTLIQPGWETATLGATLPVDLNADGNSLGWDAPFEMGSTSVFVYSIFSAVLTALQLEPLVRSGALTRQAQASAMWSSAGDAVKNNWVKFVAISVVVSLLPGLGGVLSVATIFSSFFMLEKLTRAFWCALSVEQKDQLSKAVKDAGVSMPKGMGDDPTKANDETNTEPLPNFA